MTTERPTPDAIRQAVVDQPKLRERDLAAKLGVSEGELVAAHCGQGARRIEMRFADILNGLTALGEVMALTRNESAVHEKIGPFEKVSVHEGASLVLGSQIDLRIFQNRWVHGFAVEKGAGEETRRSLQFFDAAGDAVHKVHLRPASDVAAFEALVASLLSPDQSAGMDALPRAQKTEPDAAGADAAELRRRWAAMTDTHQFHGLLRELKLPRRQAMRMVGEDFAWRLDAASVADFMRAAASGAVPIMCFVGNEGCIQIHSGPISNVVAMGPWINVMDETFHLHLRADHVAELWAVRKPVTEGHVTSIEAYDAAGQLVISFFGKRHEGEVELEAWRALAESLPRHGVSQAA